jgi:SAM-dependent methyltransferase
MDDARLVREMEGLTFYHTIPLTPTLSTPGWGVVVPIVQMVRRELGTLDLRGKRVLDVGCRDGLFCFEAERLGAAEVIGIDHDLTLGVPEFLVRHLRSRARILPFDLFDLRPESFGKFDVIVFAGVLYHLRYPCWALKLLRDVLVAGGLMVLETAVLADDNRHAMLYCPVGAESPYEPTSVTFFNRKGLHDTLASIGFRVDRSRCLMNLTAPVRAPLPDSPPIDRCVSVCARIEVESLANAYWNNGPKPRNAPTWHAAAARTPA